MLIQAKQVSKSFGERAILKEISFSIQHHSRIGLVGRNGAGKTTLANLIYGKVNPDQGSVVSRTEGLKIGYLFQSVDYTVHDFQPDHFSSEILELTSELGLTRVHTWESERLGHVSHGEKLKIALSHIWASHPDLLLLDEPTNHLDVQGVKWLVKQLKSFKGAVILISHDRYFLDHAVTEIFELENGKLTPYKGNYSAYRLEKKKRIEEQKHQYEVQQKYKCRIEAQITQMQQWAAKAHRTMRTEEGFKEYHGVKAKKRDQAVKSKLKRLRQELERNRVEKPADEPSVRFQFDGSEKRGRRVLEARDLTKHFGGRTLFSNSNYYVNYGERIGLVGPNGSGKTTFLRMLLGQESLSSGHLWLSDSAKFAFLSQDAADLPSFKTALDVLGLTHREDIFRARTLLAQMGIKAEKLSQPSETFSLGERIRLQLIAMLLSPLNLLILDEPTNHLDLPTREQLQETLSQFPGSLLIVSHDYYFLNQVCDKLLVMEDQKIKRIEMSLEQYDSPNKKRSGDSKEELLRIDTEITAILGQLSLAVPGTDRFKELDDKYFALLRRKSELN
ncbi:ribosomal protection-like ABC-F family protein [Ammoniphilus sp. YIM 78166]|uniref:ribosomal protection-like ABC-F family protein n=1 Tax=Ammoniphilus sp. YIM 78166 TaxID=1644106 RepID=UPI00106F6F31|nr:ABC-F type ribosomal protection protein [Ammoniphilus sp. YIM 78166]